jgi:hypothetical protein
MITALTTSPEYNALSDLEKDLIDFSDTYKEVRGYRPSAADYYAFSQHNDEGRALIMGSLYEEAAQREEIAKLEREVETYAELEREAREQLEALRRDGDPRANILIH